MQNKSNSFTIFIVLLTLLIVIASELLFKFSNMQMPINYYGITFFFFVHTSITFFVLKVIQTKRPLLFPKAFMTSSFIKILLSIIYIAVYWYFAKENFMVFITVFFVQYFLYTLFSVVYITKQSDMG